MTINRAVEHCLSPSPAEKPESVSDLISSFFQKPFTGIYAPVPLRYCNTLLQNANMIDITYTFFTGTDLSGEKRTVFGIDFGSYLASPGFPLSLIFGPPAAMGALKDSLNSLPPPTPLHTALLTTALRDTAFQKKTGDAVKIEAGDDAAADTAVQRPGRKTAKLPALMIQGTSSNAGKSILTAAFCRILLQEGFRVAPFKAQNMALNSFVTSDGGEMGRAQVVQAGACKVDPDVRMNPVLLKPNSDTGSQVILKGKPIGNMKVLDYYDYKRKLWETVTDCYDSLASEYDIILLEGAGSPGEVNLKAHDIVNMRMAEHAGAPVLLTGDIDRGGVFASFIGTLAVMEEWERSLIAGFLVNKFRGDASLLRPAYDYVFDYTGKQVVGTIPYLRDLGLPEEDSVSFKEELYSDRNDSDSRRSGQLTIYVIDLPHISNFTDIDPLRGEPDVSVHIIRTQQDIGRLAQEFPPDAVIIPGSKNVIKDLQFLQSTGIAEALKRYGMGSGSSPEIVGICGGFQILGNTIRDPYGIESDEEQIDGLGLLDIDTVLARNKTLTQTSGRHLEPALPVVGYEIHHGKTEIRRGRVIIETGDSVGGVASPEKAIWGTYLHGIFDSDGFRHYFLDKLRERKGLPPLEARSSYDLESAFQRLADTVRKSVDLDYILDVAGVR
jgi:cobyric acid synthase CobQ